LWAQAKAIPASIAVKSKDELQAMVLDLLKKLKLQDKRMKGAELPVSL